MGTCLGKTYMVKIHGSDGLKMQIELCETPEEMEKITVLQLKEKIDQHLSEKQKRNTERKVLSLIFKDKKLNQDSKRLSEYGIQHNSDLFLLFYPRNEIRCSPLYSNLRVGNIAGKKNDKTYMSMDQLADFRGDGVTLWGNK